LRGEPSGNIPGTSFHRPAYRHETLNHIHAAVDTTFVQFYPTLIDLAKTKRTLSAAYLKEMDAPSTK
jgi:hypothetical protein